MRRDDPSEHERALRRVETKIARPKVREASKMIYNRSDLQEKSRRLLLEEIDEVLEDAEMQVSRIM
jgi:predicted house-cleaning noncanonical NTP pyrophosphatase (MazG superfamily)